MWSKKTSLILAMLASHISLADITTKPYEPNSDVKKSLESYQVCNVTALADELGKQFRVYYMKDELAKYNYFMIKNAQNINADTIRKTTCQFIKKNNCYLYWGNVANLALISNQKAAWFPADTSPHYILSPTITCNKF